MAAYERWPRRRRRLTVRTMWRGLWPERSGDLSFWASVARRMRQRGIRADDSDAIRRLCAELEVQCGAARGPSRSAPGHAPANLADNLPTRAK
jgi:hypothetical protein